MSNEKNNPFTSQMDYKQIVHGRWRFAREAGKPGVLIAFVKVSVDRRSFTDVPLSPWLPIRDILQA